MDDINIGEMLAGYATLQDELAGIRKVTESALRWLDHPTRRGARGHAAGQQSYNATASARARADLTRVLEMCAQFEVHLKSYGARVFAHPSPPRTSDLNQGRHDDGDAADKTSPTLPYPADHGGNANAEEQQTASAGTEKRPDNVSAVNTSADNASREKSPARSTPPISPRTALPSSPTTYNASADDTSASADDTSASADDTSASADDTRATSPSANDDASREKSLARDTLPQMPLPTSPPKPSRDERSSSPARLRLDELGDGLIPALYALARDTSFAGKVAVEDLRYTVDELAAAAGEGSGAVDFTVCYEITHYKDNDGGRGGTWRLSHSELDGVELPDLSGAKVAPEEEDPEEYLNRLYEDLPSGGVPYYVGPLSGQVGSELQQLFPSGEEVGALGVRAGVSTLYGHVGEAGSGTAFHCEDADMRSYNLTLIGTKIWLLIEVNDNGKFEALVERSTGRRRRCDQAVRHAAVMFPPRQLHAAGIRFRVLVAGPGDLVVTRPREYHAVINRTTTFAIATNYVFPGEDPLPKTLRVCNKDGLYDLDHERVVQLDCKRATKRKIGANEADLAYKGKRQKVYDDGVDGADDICPPESLAQALVDSTASAASIRRFMRIVCAWRAERGELWAELRGIGGHEAVRQSIRELDRLMAACRGRSELFALLEVLTSVRLYRSLPRRALRPCQTSRVANEAVDQLLKARGLGESQRSSVHFELAKYRKWDRFCSGDDGRYESEGVLCFMPPVYNNDEGFSRRDVKRMANADVDAFCAGFKGIEHARRLCEVGQAFQRGVFGEEEFGLRPFERYEEDIDRLGVKDLLQLL